MSPLTARFAKFLAEHPFEPCFALEVETMIDTDTYLLTADDLAEWERGYGEHTDAKGLI